MINIIFFNYHDLILNKLGIMGGRLVNSTNNLIQSFSHEFWKKEFELAKICGFNSIEWVFDDLKNPILTDNGIVEINSLSKKNDISIDSVCADFFMTRKLFNTSSLDLEKNIEILKKLIDNSSKLGIKLVEIPLVDSSSMKTITQKNNLKNNIKKVLPIAEEKNIVINLETDLPPLEFKNYIESFDSDHLKVNYDVGNSTSLGYNIENELKILSKYITNIHIKDRLFNGPTVPLGKGNVDFDLFFKTLSTINYSGYLIIQGARENESQIKPTETCKKYGTFVKHYLDKY